MNLDFEIVNFIHFDMANPVFDIIMPGFSYLCECGALFLAIAVILHITKKYRRDGLIVMITIGIAFFISFVVIGNIVMRPRPYQLNETAILIPEPNGYSMPSGHATAAFAGAVALGLINRKWGYILIPVAAAIAFSRLYLYVHFPSDVIVGAAIGIVCAFIVRRAADRRNWFSRLRPSVE